MTQAEARRWILARQGLITPFEDPFDAVQAMVAVQTQYAASLPTAVAARVRKVKLGWDDAALQAGGRLIKSWTVRSTLHAHLPEDYSLLVAIRGVKAHARYLAWIREKQGLDMSQVEPLILDALAEGPLSRKDLHERVPILKTIESVGWGLDIIGLAYEGHIGVIGRGSTQQFVRLHTKPYEPSPYSALGQLFRRYLEGYAPATVSDFSHWSGLPVDLAKQAEREAGELERFEVEGMKGIRLALPGHDGIPPNPLGVKLLAKFDPLILSHRDKTLFIHPNDRTKIFRIAAQVEASVLSEGFACATWRLERKAKTAVIRVEPFRPLKIRETGRLEKEAAAMGKKLGYRAVEVLYDPIRS